MNLTLANDLPLFVLNATEHGTPSDVEELRQNWQIELTKLSTNRVQQTVDGAFHESLWRDPETAKTSVMGIHKVIEAAHKGVTLK